MDQERRAHPRFPLILAVQYLGAENVLDYTENLSESGLFIRTDREFTVGERVTLVVSFPQLIEPVELEVEVVRRREPGGDLAGGVAVRIPPADLDGRARLAEVARRVAGARAPDASFRILLVEDNALVASMYAAALRRLSETDHLPGLGIEVASDGAAAFERLLRAPEIDVVVTDVFMPVLSGITLVERLRAEPALAHLPVVVITSGGDRERDRLAGLGVAHFLRKPVSYQDLAGTIRTLFDGRAARPAPARPPAAAGEPRPEPLTDGAEVSRDPSDAKPASSR